MDGDKDVDQCRADPLTEARLAASGGLLNCGRLFRGCRL